MKKKTYEELEKSFTELQEENASLKLDMTTILNETANLVDMKRRQRELKKDVATKGLKLLRQLAKSSDLKLHDVLLQKLNKDGETQEFEQSVFFSKAQEELGIIFTYLLELEDCDRDKVILMLQSCAANKNALDKVLSFLKNKGLLFDQSKQK